MKILITGASSYVGARIFFDLKGKYDLTGTYFSNRLSDKFFQLDLTDPKAVHMLLARIKPDIIIHVANYPNAKLAKDREKEYRALNFEATTTLTAEANHHQAKIIFISSQAIYRTDNPYGKYKSLSETECQKVSAGYLILRPKLILGVSPNKVNDHTFNRMLKAVNDGATTAAFDTSWKFNPTYIGHLSQIIIQSINSNWWNLTLPVFLDTVKNQYEIAGDLLGRFGVNVLPVNTKNPFPLVEEDTSLLNRYNLNPQTYNRFIDIMEKEIRGQKQFVI